MIKSRNLIDKGLIPINSNADNQKPFKSFHLLLIEDNPIASRLVGIIISKMGHHLSSATGGELAMKLIKQTPFALIITNINLPDFSGIEICQQIRALEENQQGKKVPIIGLATQLSENEKQACLQAGMNDIFIKPLNLKAIQAIITKFLSKPQKFKKQVSLLPSANHPNNELHLFKLADFPILDPVVGINNTGSEVLLRELLTMFLNHELDIEKASIDDAYTNKNRKSLVELAHKVRSSAIYCGAVKLYTACQYTELYLNNVNEELFDKLCRQLMDVIEETKLAISNYLPT